MIDIATKIRHQYPQLNESEKQIATCILEDIESSAQMSIAELAEQSGVSQASVTRFAKSIGCKNVRELKLNLAQSAAVGSRFLRDDSTHNLGSIHSVFESITLALRDNMQLLNEESVNRAVAMLSSANRVYALGTGGGSSVLAQECQHRLFRLGVNITAYTDHLLMRMAVATLESNDALIVLSLTGQNPDLEKVVMIAQEYGVPCVVISVQGSPISQLADVLLPIQLNESDYIYSPSTARYVMMANIDVLATELAVKHKRTSRENLRRIKQQLDSYRGTHDRLPLGD
ncbi:MurR/RpiR family transcriptional regulator [Teredinibacter sp. KSP-S5-2]|uniref:MurR/RpiR family transcriptional regulator n=1 Tax=Teredinibacter sp. KSP-S5-2 TaxID=3034506 RepID=UPI002934E14E|nr:MurR/RpiR family transcriptional regulator [Teredinibacter sp. KSP-S5-2]WNO08505.1 MurR/RpiR family transcriptional regulator [Teredinibacter sp. KSP-S5-2]